MSDLDTTIPRWMTSDRPESAPRALARLVVDGTQRGSVGVLDRAPLVTAEPRPLADTGYPVPAYDRLDHDAERIGLGGREFRVWIADRSPGWVDRAVLALIDADPAAVAQVEETR